MTISQELIDKQGAGHTGDEGDLAVAVVLGGHVDDFNGGGHGCGI